MLPHSLGRTKACAHRCSILRSAVTTGTSFLTILTQGLLRLSTKILLGTSRSSLRILLMENCFCGGWACTAAYIFRGNGCDFLAKTILGTKLYSQHIIPQNEQNSCNVTNGSSWSETPMITILWPNIQF